MNYSLAAGKTSCVPVAIARPSSGWSHGNKRLAADPPHELAVGAIGKVWRPVIPFVHVANAAAFAAFSQPGYVKVAWALRVVAEGAQSSQVEFELRVAATDEDAWKKFTRHFRLIGPGSRFIRRMLLAQLEGDLGTPEAVQNDRPLPGDELIPDAGGQFTHSMHPASVGRMRTHGTLSRLLVQRHQ